MPGTIIFNPIEANLTHNTAVVSGMDPYCQVKIGNKKVSGDICYNGGKYPHWEESITLKVGDESKCVVEVRDKTMILPDTTIGSFEVDLLEIEEKGKISKWFTIMHDNKPAGEIFVEAYVKAEKNKKSFPNQKPLEEKQETEKMTEENKDLVTNQENFEFPKLEELPHPCGVGLEGADLVKQDEYQVNKEQAIPEIKEEMPYRSGITEEEAHITKKEDTKFDEEVNKEQISSSTSATKKGAERWEGEGGRAIDQEKFKFPKEEDLPTTCDVDMEREHCIKQEESQEIKESTSMQKDKDVQNEPVGEFPQPGNQPFNLPTSGQMWGINEPEVNTKGSSVDEYPEKSPKSLEEVRVEPHIGKQTKLFNEDIFQHPKNKNEQEGQEMNLKSPSKSGSKEYDEKTPQNLGDIKIEPEIGQQTKLFNEPVTEIPKGEGLPDFQTETKPAQSSFDGPFEKKQKNLDDIRQQTRSFNEESPDMVKGEEWKLSREDDSQKKPELEKTSPPRSRNQNDYLHLYLPLDSTKM